MRILFTSRGSAGHVGPLAPFARAAARAGHDVLVAVQPRHRHHVERLGLPYAALGDPPESAWAPVLAQLPTVGFDEANDLMLGDMFARVDTEAALPAMRELAARWQPDLIVRESWEYASTLVAELHGVPLARVALGLLETEEHSIRLAAPAIDRFRAELGLPRDPAGHRLGSAPFLTVMPEALEDPEAPRPAWVGRFRHEPGGVEALPDWWPGNEDPLVYLTFGSVTAAEHLPFFPRLYRASIEALAPLPIRLLVTLGEARDVAELGPLPGNVHVERWVPQEAVLQHAAVVAGHGGHGTTVGALQHGVPLAVLPLFSVDQWLNAAAVRRAGVGFHVGARPDDSRLFRISADREIAALARAVEHLLGDVPERRRAHGLASATHALPPIGEAPRVFESLVTAAAA